MARKREDLNQKSRFPATRQRIWNAIRKLGTFKKMDIEDATRINVKTIDCYLTALTKAGYLKMTPGKNRVTKRGRHKVNDEATWKLIKDIGNEAPRVTRQGEPVKQGIGSDQMWRTMKILKSFNYKELAINATTEEHEVKASTAKDYCKFLHKAGYLVVKTPAKNSVSLTVYRFLDSKNTGPRAPMIQRVKQVYDPNLNEVVYTPEPRDI